MAGLLVALAMILSYIEILFPFQVGIPGIKLGLANLVVLTALFFLSPAFVYILQVSCGMAGPSCPYICIIHL